LKDIRVGFRIGGFTGEGGEGHETFSPKKSQKYLRGQRLVRPRLALQLKQGWTVVTEKGIHRAEVTEDPFKVREGPWGGGGKKGHPGW